jgi:hypothetical protein
MGFPRRSGISTVNPDFVAAIEVDDRRFADRGADLRLRAFADGDGVPGGLRGEDFAGAKRGSRRRGPEERAAANANAGDDGEAPHESPSMYSNSTSVSSGQLVSPSGMK